MADNVRPWKIATDQLFMRFKTDIVSLVPNACPHVLVKRKLGCADGL